VPTSTDSAIVIADSYRATFADNALRVTELDDRWVHVADSQQSWIVDSRTFDANAQRASARAAREHAERGNDDCAYSTWCGGHKAALAYQTPDDIRQNVTNLLIDAELVDTIGGF
jgi:hypothetical protein